MELSKICPCLMFCQNNRLPICIELCNLQDDFIKIISVILKYQNHLGWVPGDFSQITVLGEILVTNGSVSYGSGMLEWKEKQLRT